MRIKEKFKENIKEHIEQLLVSYGVDDTENKLMTNELLLITQQEIRLREKQKWHRIEDEKPKRDNHPYYGKEYSIPVLVRCPGNKKHLARWYFTGDFNGWVDYSWSGGCKPENYDYLNVIEWMYMPD